MSYEIFSESAIGTVKEIVLDNGIMCFVKCSMHRWMVEYSVENQKPFGYAKFTVSLTEIEASSLFDEYSK